MANGMKSKKRMVKTDRGTFSLRYLQAATENEGLRALRCIETNEKPYLVAYFAAEAVSWGRRYLDAVEGGAR
jgi:hypothetical protein